MEKKTGLNKKMALEMRDKYDLTYFVETGTYFGATALWASKNFKFVYTIEMNPEYHLRATKLLGGIDNVECLCGDAYTMLPDILWIIREQEERALFYLDAYWHAGLSYPKPPNECPIEYQIDAINRYDIVHVVMVDTSPMPKSVKRGGIAYSIPSRIIATSLLKSGSKRIVTVADNNLVAEPGWRI